CVHARGEPVALHRWHRAYRQQSAANPELRKRKCLLYRSDDHHHFPTGLAGLHDAMRFADRLEAEHADGLGLELSRRNLLRDFLQRHVRQRETWIAEYKAAEEGEIDTTCHL